ncbi:MAG: S8 family serine peptidase [Bacteroidales bacterium]|nr:S8 family serine peptidase [Bacteroidales bacterium]
MRISKRIYLPWHNILHFSRISFIFFSSAVFAGGPFASLDSLDTKQINWYNLDPVNDNVQGASVDKAYNEIIQNLAPRKKVVVAIIDGGVDIYHAELEGKIWTNQDEIPGNGTDDDQNGYVDDYHGWNFLGNRDGENIHFENYEYVRIYKQYDSLYKDIKTINELPEAERNTYRYYIASREKYRRERTKYETEKYYIEFFESAWDDAVRTVKVYLDKDTLVPADLVHINTNIDSVRKSVEFLSYVYQNGLTPESIKEYKQNNSNNLNKKLNPDVNYRAILSDDPTDIGDTDYGNNDVKGPSSEHGTFVSGIIAASRDNGTGINGIAENTEIMILRAVPDGDEYDKDIALAILYAVDNGADIINMSFGKGFSPQKKFVDEALQYAGEKNVLVIHSAGNDANDIDETMQYPTKAFSDGTMASNYITVGATTGIPDEFFVADFSNFGRKNVDVFAPGVDIVSLYPEDKYNLASGTSFSGPVVSGVAALVWSYYPELQASEIKDIILQSAARFEKLKVYYPADEGKRNKKTKFRRLSQTGGIVNAYNAMKLAEKVAEEKKVH